ncbi:MAG: sugar kinase [Pseudomonadales bacterium]|jgi:2-dehydro-3-deoxygluconokinase
MTVVIRKTGCAAIGECMLELSETMSSANPRQLTLSFGGDTLNTALYLARLGLPTHYCTMLGTDAESDWMINQWQREKIDSSTVFRAENRRPGLYWIKTDERGERSFSYWRSDSPARELFDDASRVETLTAHLASLGFCYLSGITLSLYAPHGREALLAMLGTLKDRGVCIVFDSNYRPQSWPSVNAAQQAMLATAALADIVMPSFDDEAALFGDPALEVTLDRYATLGVREIVLKDAAQGAVIRTASADFVSPAEQNIQVIDSTAAGDSFNAGYLAARYLGAEPEAAAIWGHRLASHVICHKGAIIPHESMPALPSMA